MGTGTFALLALAVSVRTLEGAFEDELTSLDGETARFAAREVPRRALLSLDWTEREARPGGPHAVVMEDGCVLNCELKGLAGETLLTAGVFSVPIEFVSAVVFAGGRPREADRRPAKDVLLLASGDELSGALVDVGERKLVFESRLGARDHPFAELRALLTSSRLSRAPAREVAVELTDGSVVPFEYFEVVEVASGVAFGSPVSLSRRSVSRASFRPAGAVELGEWERARHEPAREAEDGMFPPRRGLNVLARPLKMGGRTFLSGVGVRPPARIEWRLPAGAKLLRGLCGLDDAARGAGRATVRFFADGTEVWSGELRGRGALDVVARLGGAKRLAFVVEEGPDGTDRADYVDAVELFVVAEKEG